MESKDLEYVRRLRRCGHLLYHKFNLNGSQMHILLVLRDAPMTQKQLTDRLRIQPGSLSEILNKVERAGWVEKRRSMTDRRNFELMLTPAGREAADRFEKHQSEQADLLMQPFNGEQKQQLAALLDQLIEHWEALETQNTDK